eukprot:3745626-Rhodomonas_salina.1
MVADPDAYLLRMACDASKRVLHQRPLKQSPTAVLILRPPAAPCSCIQGSASPRLLAGSEAPSLLTQPLTLP